MGVAANAVIFSVANALWFRPLPFPASGRIAVVYEPLPRGDEGGVWDVMQYRMARQLVDVPLIENVVLEASRWNAMSQFRPVVELLDGPSPVTVAGVSHGYFPAAGAYVHGRNFREEEDDPTAELVAIVSEGYRKRLGLDKNIVGHTLATTLGELRIVGVAPPSFKGVRVGEEVDLWLPLGCVIHFARQPSGLIDLLPVTAYVRLHPGVTFSLAEREVQARLGRSYQLIPLERVRFSLRAHAEDRRQTMLISILAAAAGAVLLIGCVNLAALFLARGTERENELAIRLAVGATPLQLSRQVLVELFIVGAIGLVLGFVVSSAVHRWISHTVLPTGLALETLDVSPDWRILLAGFVLTLLALSLASLAPVVQARRARAESLWTGSSASPSKRAVARQQVAVVVHVAMTCALLTIAIGLARIVLTGYWSDRGLDSNRLVLVRVEPRLVDYWSESMGESDASRLASDFARLVEALRSQPGVAGIAEGAWPAALNATTQAELRTAGGHQFNVHLLLGTNGYPAMLGVRLRGGRTLGIQDLHRSPRAALVDLRLAERLGGEAAALGSHVRISSVPYEIVGIIEPLSAATRLDDTTPTVVAAWEGAVRRGSSLAHFVVRSNDSAERIVRSVTDAVRAVFPDAPTLQVRTASELTSAALSAERFGAVVFGWYAVAALGLAAAGLFGLAGMIVARNRLSLGIRSALGAEPSRVCKGLLGSIVPAVGVGLVLGVGLTWLSSRALMAIIPEYAITAPLDSAIAILSLAAVTALSVAGPIADAAWESPASLLRVT